MHFLGSWSWCYSYDMVCSHRRDFFSMNKIKERTLGKGLILEEDVVEKNAEDRTRHKHVILGRCKQAC